MYQLPLDINSEAVSERLSEIASKSIYTYLQTFFLDMELFQQYSKAMEDENMHIDPERLDVCIRNNTNYIDILSTLPMVKEFYDQFESSPLFDASTGKEITRDDFVCRVLYRLMDVFADSQNFYHLSLLEEWMLQLLLREPLYHPVPLNLTMGDEVYLTHNAEFDFAEREDFYRYEDERERLLFAVQNPAAHIRTSIAEHRENLLFRPESYMLNYTPFLMVCIRGCAYGFVSVHDLLESFANLDIKVPEVVSSTYQFLKALPAMEHDTSLWLLELLKGKGFNTIAFYDPVEGMIQVPVSRWKSVRGSGLSGFVHPVREHICGQ